MTYLCHKAVYNLAAHLCFMEMELSSDCKLGQGEFYSSSSKVCQVMERYSFIKISKGIFKCFLKRKN